MKDTMFGQDIEAVDMNEGRQQYLKKKREGGTIVLCVNETYVLRRGALCLAMRANEHTGFLGLRRWVWDISLYHFPGGRGLLQSRTPLLLALKVTELTISRSQMSFTVWGRDLAYEGSTVDGVL
jgi:hypothetical protein